MGSQGFRNIAGNPFVYQEDVRSAAFGLDATATKWKLVVSSTTGALPTDTAQITIDPAAAGDITIAPAGTGKVNLGTTSYPKTVAIGDVLVASAANTVDVISGAATATYVLTANGAGTAPTFQANPGENSVQTLTGDSGSATGTSIAIAGGTNITTAATGSTVTVNLDNSILLTTGGGLKTNVNNADTLLLQAYNTNTTSYTTFATLTAGNPPTFDLDTAVTIGTKYIYRVDGTDVAVTDGGTGASSLTDHGILLGSATAAITATAAPTDGQLLIGHTGSDPDLATLSAGTGITITNASGSITVSANSTTLNNQTNTTYTLLLTDAGKFITFTNADPIAVTVPTNASVAFAIGTQIGFMQGGAGQVTFSGAVPPTLVAADTALTTVKKYSVGFMVKIATDTWVFGGDMEA